MHDNADSVKLVTVNEAAELLRVVPRTVRSWRAAGLLRAVKYPGASNTRVVFRMSEIERFISAHTEGSERCDSQSCGMESADAETGGSSAGVTVMAARESRLLSPATIAAVPNESAPSESGRPIGGSRGVSRR